MALESLATHVFLVVLVSQGVTKKSFETFQNLINRKILQTVNIELECDGEIIEITHEVGSNHAQSFHHSTFSSLLALSSTYQEK